MARFVIVHGAFTGAWIWGPLAERLRSAGHVVEVFDLPGLGDDATPPQDVTLDSCAARLGEVLTASAEPAILVGNSMGGVIATQAAARNPGSVAALVYATAFVPRDGQSLLDLLLERVAQRAARDGEDDRERHDAVVQLEVAHHVELGDRTLELRVDHLLERLQELVAARFHEVERSANLACRRPTTGGEALCR